MSLDTVDVVHELEDALGAAAHDARAVAGIIRRTISDRFAFEPEIVDRLVGAVEAIADSADAATGPGSALAEWRED